MEIKDAKRAILLLIVNADFMFSITHTYLKVE